MTSCYREFNQKSKGNKVKKGTTTASYSNNNQIAKYYFFKSIHIHYWHHIFHFRNLPIDIDTVSRYNIHAEDTTTSQKFLVYEITTEQDFYASQSLLSSKSRTVSLNWDNSIKVKPCNAGFVWCLFVCRFFIFLITDVKQLIYLVCKKVKSRLRFQCLL